MPRVAELTVQLRRPTGVKVAVVSFLVTVCVGCASATIESNVSAPPVAETSGTPSATSNTLPSQTTTSVPLVPHSVGADDVVLQVGEYNLGLNIDEFVFSPEFVLYGDGRLYAELADGVRNGVGQSLMRQAHLTEEQMQALLRPGEKLPDNPTMNTLAADAVPTLIVTASHRWEVTDLQEPFRSYLAELRDEVRSLATTAWNPTRWIIRQYPAPTCTVSTSPTEHSYYDAPVFPGELGRYPLGPLDCYAAP